MNRCIALCVEVLKASTIRVFFLPFLTLASNISLLIAFLLPLKVLILLGGTEIPEFFPVFMRNLEYKDLIVALMVIAGGLYLLHLLLQWLINFTLVQESEYIISKLKAPDNQRGVMLKVYKGYALFFSSVLFTVCACFFMAYIYLSNFLVQIMFYFIILVFVLIFIRISTSFKDEFTKKITMYVQVIVNIIFFISFVYIIYEHFEGKAPGLLSSMITLILVRQTGVQLRNIAASFQIIASIKHQILAGFPALILSMK